MPSLSLRLLGALQVTLEGTSVTGFQSNKERALLAYLAEESQQPHSRQKLAGLLWPERPEAAARNNLRRTLSNLRRMIGDRTQGAEPFLLVTHRTIRFNAASDAWIDAEVFGSLLASRQQPSPPQLEQAIGLYRSDFLEGFSLPDSPLFEEWMTLCRERYQRLMREALHQLVGAYQAQGDRERALKLAWRLVDREPWWEQAHRQLIRLLALSGRRSEALAQYHMCRRLLAEELAVAPSPETTDLFRQIRDGNLAGIAPSPQRCPTPTHNLPLASGPFVGRESEIAEIQDCLQDPACRLLTLVGAGGMGKTRLAVQAVADWMSHPQEDGLDGVTLVLLAPVQTAKAIAPAIAQAAGFPLSPDREPGQQLLEILRQKRWLLILDSFEHLPEGAGFVAEILRTAPCVKVLVTSRARLNLQDEYCFSVSGIEFPHQIPEDAGKARSFAAVELFLQAARQVQPGFAPADTDLTEITRICRQVQGMPLGILLAAAWSGVLRPAEIAAEIGQGLDFLRADWPDVPEQQRSLRAVFDRSWILLSEREREVFLALSVFVGRFTRAAAQQVSGASLYELKALVDRSLLQVTPSGRYDMHELLRQYAVGKLASRPNLGTAARDRHCAYYTGAVERWEADMTGSRQEAVLLDMEVERENIRSAWNWAVEQFRVERLDRAMGGMERFWWQGGRFREAEAALGLAASAVASAAERAAGDAERVAACLRVQVRAMAWQSNFLRALGQREAAGWLHQQCMAVLNDPALAGQDTRLERAILYWCMGATISMTSYARARQHFEESYTLFRDLGYTAGMAWALNASGSMCRFLGEYPQARRRVEEALAIYRGLVDESGVTASLSRLAAIACVQGRLEEGERLARQAVATALAGSDRSELAFSLLQLGDALEKAAKFSEAHAVSQKSLDLYCDVGHSTYITEAHGVLASIDLHRGRTAEARDHVETGLAIAREHGPPYCVGLNLLLQGCLALSDGAAARAVRHLEESIVAYRACRGNPDELACALANLALAAHALEDIHGAGQYLGHALQITQDSGAMLPLLWALPAMALLLAGKGEVERAVEMYALASRYPLVARSRWFADVAGNTLAEVAATLPPGRVAVLQERGRARDPQAAAAQLRQELRR
jgi:DNA-binding SARP family transcriptional activator/predicted ATPase